MNHYYGGQGKLLWKDTVEEITWGIWASLAYGPVETSMKEKEGQHNYYEIDGAWRVQGGIM